uniref:Uncharacterized protein n=1 Tax=Arundo donax TaxID=35708 RepID=A0A0A9BAG1_ARUDO
MFVWRLLVRGRVVWCCQHRVSLCPIEPCTQFWITNQAYFLLIAYHMPYCSTALFIVDLLLRC